MKVFNEKQNIGKSKYVVNFHDGVQTHKDGSPFFDIRIFSNRRENDKFVKELKAQGYVEENRVRSYFAKYWVEKGTLVGGVPSSQTCRYESLDDLRVRIETVKEFNPDAKIQILCSALEPEIITGNKLNPIYQRRAK